MNNSTDDATNISNREIAVLRANWSSRRGQILFNAGLEAKAKRAIDFGEKDSMNESALKELIRAAIAFNISSGKKK